jgi:hypothetical protein
VIREDTPATGSFRLGRREPPPGPLAQQRTERVVAQLDACLVNYP